MYAIGMPKGNKENTEKAISECTATEYFFIDNQNFSLQIKNLNKLQRKLYQGILQSKCKNLKERKKKDFLIAASKIVGNFSIQTIKVRK